MKFVVYKDRKGEFRWRLVAANSRTIADSAEGYKRRAAAVKAAATLHTAMATSAIPIEFKKTGAK
jgi:uncharacterized protein